MKTNQKLNLPTIPQLVMHKCLLFAKDEDYFYLQNPEGPLELTNQHQTSSWITAKLVYPRFISRVNPIEH